MDNLFKEKFKNFSETPDEKVWENIEASLNKKKKKRVVPIWWQLGGAAAALALLFYFISPFGNDDQDTTPTIVDVEEKMEKNPQRADENEIGTVKISPESQESQIVENEPNIVSEGQNNSSEGRSNRNAVNTKDRSLGIPKQHKGLRSIETLADNNNSKEKGKLVQKDGDTGNVLPELPMESGGEVVANDKVQETAEDKPATTEPTDTTFEKDGMAIAENKEEEGKKSIYEAIEEQKELEKEVAQVKKTDRWAMGPSVAPVFFGSVGEGSPIHSNFASNSKSGNLNLSYGLTVTYNVSKKLSIRSGVHRVDYGYDTNDVVFTSSLTTSTNQLIDNINYAQTSRNLVVESKNNEVTALSDNTNALVAGTAQPFEGRMVQQLGYVEVPMELNYALVDKKFGVNLIGGFSSLFLVDNAVSLESDQLITEMGEANNANDISFSTNIGVGFNYEISQKLQLNVEPIFKYQLNTFSETAGNFRPYAVGVYSGLRFRF